MVAALLLVTALAAPAGAAPAGADTAAGRSCDRLAAFNDGRAETPPVPLRALDAPAAVSACRAALAGPGARPRFHLQLARALLKQRRLAEARRHLSVAVMQEVPAAAFVLGQLHHTGTGVARDEDRAMTLYRRSLKAGYLPAAFGMLMLYEDPASRHYDPETAEETRLLLTVNGLL